MYIKQPYMYPDTVAIEHLEYNLPRDKWEETFTYSLNQLNRLSGMIKSHPDCQITRHSFYTLKSIMVHFMYNLCQIINEYEVKLKNIYRDEQYDDNLYELSFNINNTQIDITVKETDEVYKGYLEHLFKDFQNNPDIKNNYINDYSDMSDKDVYDEYMMFINYILENNLFFATMYNKNYILDLLQKHIFHGTQYYVHKDPLYQRRKLDWYDAHQTIYVYKFDADKDTIMTAKLRQGDLCRAWSSSETEWKEYSEIAIEMCKNDGYRRYKLNNPKYDKYPLMKAMGYALQNILKSHYTATGEKYDDLYLIMFDHLNNQ